MKDGDFTLANVEDGKTITIYDSFFKKAEGDEKGLNARSSIILHETAHLLGMDSDEESGNFASAECLRNFTLLVCEIVKLEDLEGSLNPTCEAKAESEDSESQPEENSSESAGRNPDAPQNEDGFGEKELPYSPDQPRAPKGQSDGGRWVGGGNGGGVESDSDGKEKGKSEKSSLDKEDGRGNSGNEDSSDTEPKGSLNLLDGGLKSNNDGVWAATNLTVKNLKPGRPHTIVIGYDYEYIGLDGEPKTESHKIAIDAVSDENGVIDLYRVGIIYISQNDSKYKNLEGKDMEIGIKVSEAEGSVRDNYGDVDKLDPKDKNQSQGQKDAFEDKYGLGAYAAEHASQNQWLNTPKSNNYGGGGIDGREDPNDLKEVAHGSIKYSGKTREMKIDGDIENTGRGKGRNTDK